MVGAELGEDRDHHAPEQVALLGVLGLADQALKRLERGLGIVTVPGRECLVERPGPVRPVLAGAREQAGSGGEALRLEVAREAIEELQRLVRVVAVEQQAPQLARRDSVVSIQLERLAQGLLVVSDSELVRGGGDDAIQELLDLRRRDGTRELGDDLPVLERLDRRNAADLKARRKRLIGVGVHLRQLDLAVPLGDGGLEGRGQGPARAAPLGPEVHHHRNLA